MNSLTRELGPDGLGFSFMCCFVCFSYMRPDYVWALIFCEVISNYCASNNIKLCSLTLLRLYYLWNYHSFFHDCLETCMIAFFAAELYYKSFQKSFCICHLTCQLTEEQAIMLYRLKWLSSFDTQSYVLPCREYGICFLWLVISCFVHL